MIRWRGACQSSTILHNGKYPTGAEADTPSLNAVHLGPLVGSVTLHVAETENARRGLPLPGVQCSLGTTMTVLARFRTISFLVVRLLEPSCITFEHV